MGISSLTTSAPQSASTPPADGPARLAVFDARGRQVRVLAEGRLPAGMHTVGWDGRDGDGQVLASGVYFYAPDVVRTMSRMYGAFDAVLIGSGDRENPNATDNDDRFYMLRDRQTGIYATAAPTAGECDDGSSDHRCDLPLTNADLYDASANDIQDAPTRLSGGWWNHPHGYVGG